MPVSSLDHLYGRIDRAESSTRRLQYAPTVPQYDLQGSGSGTGTEFTYVVGYGDNVSNPLNTDTWYSISADYNWTDFSNATFSFSVDGYASGDIDVSGLANPGKPTGLRCLIIDLNPGQYFCVDSITGPGGTLSNQQGAVSSDTQGGRGCTRIGGSSGGETENPEIYNDGILNAGADNSASIAIDLYVPSVNSAGSFFESDNRVFEIGCGDGGGLSTGVILVING